MPHSRHAARNTPASPAGLPLRTAVLLIALSIAGCAAARLERHGDRASAHGDAIAARSHYERALAIKPKLAEKPAFADKVKTARTEGATQEGFIALDQGRYDTAIARFDTALGFNAAHKPAAEGKQSAKAAAAHLHYTEALADADDDDLATARASLERALDYVPSYPKANAALASLAGDAEPSGGASAEMRAGRDAAQARRWADAIDAYAAVVAADPTFLPARAQLTRSRTAMTRAQNLKREGIAALEGRRLDAAIAALDESASIDPHDTRTGDALRRARALRRQADESLVQARKRLASDRWDDALAAVAEARAVFPGHPDAAASGRAIRLAAAESYTGRARAARARDEAN